jgi:hypothetical protein
MTKLSFKIVFSYILWSVYFLSCSVNESKNESIQAHQSMTTKRILEEDEAGNDEDQEINVDDEENVIAEEELTEDEFNPDEDIYPDGKYVADVDYYNSETGTESFYSLDVKVRNGKLVEIEFDNGGWLDDTHFYPERIRRGKARFTDDRNRDWEVKLKRFKY